MRWGVLACKSEIRVWCTRYKAGKEILRGGCGVGVVDEAEVVVERVHGEEHEIVRGGRFLPANPKSESRGLGFGPWCTDPSAGCRVDMWGGCGVVIWLTAHYVGEIAWGVGFG